MIKVPLTNGILKYITEIDKNRYMVSSVKLSKSVANRLRKNSKKKSSYASNKIEGNPLSEQQANDVIDADEHKHFLKPEQEVRKYFLVLNYLEQQAKEKAPFSKELILAVQKLVEKGVPFNGTGHSGMGAYHGEWGFREFTHPTTVLRGKTRLNLPLREHPYSGRTGDKKMKLLKLFEK